MMRVYTRDGRALCNQCGRPLTIAPSEPPGRWSLGICAPCLTFYTLVYSEVAGGLVCTEQFRLAVPITSLLRNEGARPSAARDGRMTDHGQ